MDGYFDSSVIEEGLEEMMLFHENGGSLAAFCLTRCGGFFSGIMQSVIGLLDAVFIQKQNTIGEAILSAKKGVIRHSPDKPAYLSPAVMFTLLGDPALSLPPDMIITVTESANRNARSNIHFKLHCYPNPFNSSIKINYSIPYCSPVTLEIYNSLGERLIKHAAKEQAPGDYQFLWDAANASGKKAAAGIYFYKLNVNGKTEASKKCLLLK